MGCEPLSLPFAFLLSIENMGSTLCLFMFMRFLLLLSSFYPVVADSSSFMQQPLCHDSESSALLQFKQSFLIDGHASEGEGSDCCSWDGVECDRETGHVIGLHLASSCLYGSINSSNTLFSLVHLRRLDLSDNDFNYSEIPFSVGQLLRLRSLNLSDSAFAAQIPSELLALSNLLANLSSLTTLFLRECGLHGEFPMNIFQLPSLKFLSLPTSIGRLGSLTELDISSCNFTGLVPSPLGHLPQLSYLDLSNNSFSGQIPSSMANLTQLTFLVLSFNNFSIPSWLMNLTQLTVLELGTNNLEGGIPMELNMLLKLKNLTSFQLSGNSLSLLGYTRTNVTLPKFKLLGLDSCNLTEFPDFLRNQDELVVLSLANNKIHGPLPIPPPSTIEYYSVSRNKLIGEISPLICNVSSLMLLDLSSNNLSGRIPQCLDNLSKSLSVLDLGSNSLDGPFPQTCTVTNNLRVVDLDIANDLRGMQRFFEKIPDILIAIDFSGNNFKGQIPTSTGNLKGLHLLNLGDNNLTGHIPSSLGNLPQLESLDLSPN
ncbi:unnamed protein product, partial [Vitis vinifera]|uniref:Leucine-rich repeat-containing N-terminal plant-type domain-containing protein n=1 Tax=Vitis vinifera TaxID=29760 RepID=D7U7C5_VITVI